MTVTGVDDTRNVAGSQTPAKRQRGGGIAGGFAEELCRLASRPFVSAARLKLTRRCYERLKKTGPHLARMAARDRAGNTSLVARTKFMVKP